MRCILIPLLITDLIQLGQPFQSFRALQNRRKFDSSNINHALKPGNSDEHPRSPLDSFIRFSSTKLMAFSLLASVVKRVSAADLSSSQLPSQPRPSRRPFAYSVEMTSPPSLIPRSSSGEDSLLSRLSRADVTIFGSHVVGPLSILDASLEANLISKLLKKTRGRGDKSKSNNIREIAIGLPLPANPEITSALEKYTLQDKEESASSADDELVQTISKFITPSSSSDFSFERFLPILRLARQSRILLLPLDSSNTVKETVLADGLGGLPEEARAQLVPDTEGFLQSAAGSGFKSYSDNVLLTGYGDLIRTKNGTGTVAPFENYIASRIIRDEVMAARAAQWKKSNPNAMLLLLLSAEQTKYGYGVQERIKRNINKYSDSPVKSGEVLSVLLNPTALDSYSPTVQLRLALAYGAYLKDQRPLSDFLWFSVCPPVKLLTRLKNEINAEGEKPPGESSILKAF